CSGCGQQSSVVLTIQGQTLPDEIAVLGAHLDSICSRSGTTNGQANCDTGVTTAQRRAPGADDDASGIAVLTEVLRVVLDNGYRPQRTVKFMGYAAEEVGLVGSN